jgi:hypothetical protein
MIKPFIGIDGEGAGADQLGRQEYRFIAAGASGNFHRSSLYTGNRLATAEILEFLLALPREAILVGYFFTYDVTMILRDVSKEKIARIYTRPSEHSAGFSRYTYWHEYAIEFLHRQYFRVARVHPITNRVIPFTSRTVNEVGGFFQKAFVESCKTWSIGTEKQIATIAENKARRSEFTEISAVERDYCRLECKLLAQLMEKFRTVTDETGTTPLNWRGAGAIAAQLYRTHKATRTSALPERPQRLNRYAEMAYFGGRFEVMKLGNLKGPIYEHDINSAYPAAMPKLPCSLHTRWHRFDGAPPDSTRISVSDVAFDHSERGAICNLPIRTDGRLFWPRRARGIYWSPEIGAAIAAGTAIADWFGGYWAEETCDCRPYEWIGELYEYRRQLGKAERGYPLKLGINALYGKKAQRQGSGPWRDVIEAGLITAFCRAELIGAYHGHEADIVMLATDGVFSTVPLPVNIGDGLGEWETKTRPSGLFVVQPGIYWSPGSNEMPRTRGIPRSRIIAERDRFERVFDKWVRGDGDDKPPSVEIELNTFIGHALAAHRLPPVMAGQWLDIKRNISFDWGTKRARVGAVKGGSVETRPLAGGWQVRSEIYDPKLLTELEEQEWLLEAAPDYEPLGNTGE